MAQIGYKNTDTVTERPNRLMDQFILSTTSRGRKTIDNWRKALQAAENADTPNRKLLYDLYDELAIDADLRAEWEQRRKLRILGADFDLVDEAGKPNPEATEMLMNTWFRDFISYALDSQLWGHSLIELGSELDENGLIASVDLCPRAWVIPEKGLFVNQVGDTTGIEYRTDPKYVPWLIEVGKKRDLGLLNNLAPYILFLRFAMSAWSEFAEKFGMPARVVKTDTVDTKNVNRLYDMLDQMGTAFFAVIGKDDELDWVETAKTNGDIYRQLVEMCMSKISKLLNGAVIGEASQGGSRSKEEVGMDISTLITGGDMMFIENLMKHALPKLIAIGYPFEGLKFRYQRKGDMQAQWTIVSGILEYYNVPAEYITDTFGVPVEAKTTDPGAESAGPPKPKPKPKPGAPTADLSDFFA